MFWQISCFQIYSEYRLYVYMWFEPEHNYVYIFTFQLFPGFSQFDYDLLHSLFSKKFPAVTLFA